VVNTHTLTLPKRRHEEDDRCTMQLAGGIFWQLIADFGLWHSKKWSLNTHWIS